MLLGLHLTLLIGPTAKPLPAPPFLLEALQSVEVTQGDEERSGFQITFRAARGDVTDMLDYKLLRLPLLRPFNRVILLSLVDFVPRVLMDGFITHQQLDPAKSLLTVTGEDVSIMMDLEEKSAEHPALDEKLIATKIILTYAQYGLIPQVMPPPILDRPSPIERTPVQQGTDLAYLKTMAQRFGYVFYIKPGGPVPLTNTAYWGPPERLGVPQPALAVNMGHATNVESLTFKNDALVPTRVLGVVQDRLSNLLFPVGSLPLPPYNLPPLESKPSLRFNQPNVRTRQFRQSGVTGQEAFARAQGITDAANAVVTAEGEVNVLRYGSVLQARGLIGVRGAGFTYDGLYYVKRVKHLIRKHQYKQQLTLTREGVGLITPAIVP
jgi:hypothetical protein